MKRRALLTAAVAGGLLAVAPLWIRRAFAAETRSASEVAQKVAEVAAALRRAQASGKPLLVLVIPNDDGEKWTRGETFGMLLNHGTDDQLMPLALCEVVCARPEDLARVVPAAGSGEPLMVLVDARSDPASARSVDGAIPVPPNRPRRFDESESDDEAWARSVIRASAALVRGAVLASPAMAAIRSEDARRAAAGASIDSLPAVRAEKALTAPATERAAIAASLAREVRGRLRARPPVGARWANSAGCGVDIEGIHDNERVAIGCGMGHTPAKAQRFLYFWTKSTPY